MQEMTLLRAAKVTKATKVTGRPAFVIVTRDDQQRRLMQTRYGGAISSTPTGFKTELTIRPVDTVADAARMPDATSVTDPPGPLYHEETKPA